MRMFGHHTFEAVKAHAMVTISEKFIRLLYEIIPQTLSLELFWWLNGTTRVDFGWRTVSHGWMRVTNV